jgi:hydroxyacylglutathione hydrolase
MVQLTRSVHMIGSGAAGISNPTDANTYLIASGNEAMLIDAGSGIRSDVLIDNVEVAGVPRASVKLLLNTHSHWDHARGDYEVQRLTGCAVGVHEAGVPVVTEERWAAHPGGFGFVSPPAAVVDVAVTDGATYTIGDLTLTALYTPGHTADSVCYLLEEDGRKMLFTGDLILGEGVAGAAWYNSDLLGFKASIDRVVGLAPDAILPGHRLFSLANGQDVAAQALKSFTSVWHGYVTEGFAFAPTWCLGMYGQDVVNRPTRAKA